MTREQALAYSGRIIYVVKDAGANGALEFRREPNSEDFSDPDARLWGHGNLAGFGGVLVAGTGSVHAGRIVELDNWSGHYQTWGQLAERDARRAFADYGFDLSGTKFDHRMPVDGRLVRNPSPERLEQSSLSAIEAENRSR